MNNNKKSFDVMCLMSRTEFGELKPEVQNEIIPFHYAFQNSAYNIRLISSTEGTIVKILAHNIYVDDAHKCLWSGIHDLISPNSDAYLEIHNFDKDGSTLDIERYMMSGVVLSIVKASDRSDAQVIQITGYVSSEILTIENIPEGMPELKNVDQTDFIAKD